MKLQFQRWPRSVQTAFVQCILLLGIALGAAGGTPALYIACGFTLALGLRHIARRKRR